MTMPPPLPAVTSYGHVVNDTAMAFSQARAAFLPPAATSLVSSSVATQPIRRAADPPPLLTSSGETFTIIRVAAAMQYGDHAYVRTGMVWFAYSRTSSAQASVGMLRLSALLVFDLLRSSYLVGPCTGSRQSADACLGELGISHSRHRGVSVSLW